LFELSKEMAAKKLNGICSKQLQIEVIFIGFNHINYRTLK